MLLLPNYKPIHEYLLQIKGSLCYTELLFVIPIYKGLNAGRHFSFVTCLIFWNNYFQIYSLFFSNLLSSTLQVVSLSVFFVLSTVSFINPVGYVLNPIGLKSK
jgi:hypothetical protein